MIIATSQKSGLMSATLVFLRIEMILSMEPVSRSTNFLHNEVYLQYQVQTRRDFASPTTTTSAPIVLNYMKI